MQQHRIISLASILVMLLIPVMGWFLVAQPQFDAAAAADSQRAALDAQNGASAALVAQLKSDSERLPELTDDLNKLRGSIPAGIDPSGYIDGLDALAQIAGVQISGLTVNEATAYVPAVPPVDPNAVAPDATAGPDPVETDAPVAPASDPAIVTSPLITSENFVAIPVTIEIKGEWDPILRFVDGLQSNNRLFLVSKLQTTQDEGGTSLTATIGGFIYAIPTGIEGNPHPISTIVKQMTPTAPPVEETDGATDGGATPAPSDTPAP